MLRTVYIVDDDACARGTLRSLLSTRQGMAIHVFQSGDDFLAGKDGFGPGVVLLDYDMPGASGLDVLRMIAGDRRFATILLTGWCDVALAVRAMKAGAIDFVQKPYDAAALLELVDAAANELEAGLAVYEGFDAAKARLDRLSPRERDVLEGLIAGHRNRAIAQELGISTRTVEIYRGNMMEKLGATSLAEALRIAFAAEIG